MTSRSGQRDDKEVTFTTQLECGHGSVLASEPGRLVLAPVKESMPSEGELLIGGYNVCIEIANPHSEAITLAVDVDLSGWFEEDWARLPLRLPYWRRQTGLLMWSEADAGQSNSISAVHLHLPLDADESIVLSTIPHYGYSDCCRALRRLSQTAGRAVTTRSIGPSTEGRDILALEVGKEDAPRVVIFGSPRPGEPSAWGLVAMARELLTTSRWQAALERFRVCLVPQPNPDGIVHGRCYGNSLGQPIPLDWLKDPADHTHESRAMWAYLASGPLALAGQFDFAPATTRLTDWPRPIAVDIYHPRSAEIHARLAALSGEPGLFPRDRRDPAEQQITHHAARQWQCPAFCYRYAGLVTSPCRAEQRAIQVLEVALDSILET